MNYIRIATLLLYGMIYFGFGFALGKNTSSLVNLETFDEKSFSDWQDETRNWTIVPYAYGELRFFTAIDQKRAQTLSTLATTDQNYLAKSTGFVPRSGVNLYFVNDPIIAAKLGLNWEPDLWNRSRKDLIYFVGDSEQLIPSDILHALVHEFFMYGYIPTTRTFTVFSFGLARWFQIPFLKEDLYLVPLPVADVLRALINEALKRVQVFFDTRPTEDLFEESKFIAFDTQGTRSHPGSLIGAGIVDFLIFKKGMKGLLDSWLNLSTATDPKEIHHILETFGSACELESHLRKFIHSQAENLKPQQ